FKSSRLTFFFALAPDTYLIKVLFEDKNSGKTFSRETEFVLREWKHKDFLISDLEYYDTYTHEPVISLDNNFGNRTDFILIQFQTYQRDLDKNYTFSLDIYKQRKTVEKVGLAFVNFFKSIFSTDTLEEVKEPIYIRTWEEIRAKHFMKHADMIDKTLFSDIEFPRNELPPRKLVARVISTLHEQERIAIEEFDDKRVAQLDSINMNTFDFNQNAVVDDGEITIATARNEISSEFSFQWEFIPQTKAEIQDAFEKLTYLNIDSLDYYAGLDLESAQKYFSGIWVNRSTTDEEFMHPLNAMQLYYRKLDFCVANFPDISQDNAGAIDGSRRRFTNRGWISDKAKIYMKYGSPDEIHGDNIFNSKGIMIEHKERPPVQLWVYNQSGRKFYFKENSLITYN
ncbi:MAG: hypothetical protein KDD94_12310, partial [Calditrichaeota bacterium]|nr:hypothetical protein [Calditrichota bacterium]